MTWTGGVDVGSTQTKALLLDAGGRIVGRSLIDTGGDVVRAAEVAFERALEGTGVDRASVGPVIGTGYGRYKVEFGDDQVTEIACHARGAAHMFPGTRTVLDMGGQDTKAIRVQEDGEVVDFCMNDKCAAGTGRFLQSAAAALDLTLDELGPTALSGERPVKISNTCTVFAESEVLNWLARGRKVEDILRGVHRSIGRRSFGLLRRVGIEEDVTFTGGVSRNEAMVAVMEEYVETPINVSDDSHYMGALGAALFALDRVESGRAGVAAEGAGSSRGGEER